MRWVMPALILILVAAPAAAVVYVPGGNPTATAVCADFGCPYYAYPYPFIYGYYDWNRYSDYYQSFNQKYLSQFTTSGTGYPGLPVPQPCCAPAVTGAGPVEWHGTYGR